MLSANIISGDYQTMKELSNFENKEQINILVRKFLYTYKHELTPATIKTLKIVSRLAVKVPGVCWSRIEKLVEYTGKSRSTIHRALSALEKLGIIERKKTIRRKGGYGHLVIVFKPMENLCALPCDTSNDTTEMTQREESEKPHQESDQQQQNKAETKIFKTKTSKRNKNIIRNEKREPSVENYDLDETFVDKEVPKEFVNETKKGFNAIGIEKLWNSTKAAFKNAAGLLMYQDTTLAISAFKQTVKAYKQKKVKKDFGAYYYGTLVEMIRDQEREVAAEQRRQAMERKQGEWPFVNWLDG